MNNTQELYQQCREEVNRLKRELKAAKQPTRELHERYNAALQKLKQMQDDYEWEKSIGREYSSAQAYVIDKHN